METATQSQYRWLEPDELVGIEPLFKARGWVPLNPNGSRVLAAFDGGRMIGFICLNMIPHVEPLFVETSYRGTGIAETLVREMVSMLYLAEAPAAYVIADSPTSAKMAEAFGMARVESPVFRKVV